MNFIEISSPVAPDFDQMNMAIIAELSSEVALIEQIGHYLINSGGKRLRPLVTLLSSRALGYTGEDHIKVATVIEFFHTSTLLHDDVVDESTLRRGKPTANARWGNAASVLVGDFLLSRAFQLVVSLGDLRLLEILSDATRTIAEGEVMQLSNCKNPDISEDTYLKTIEYKTAKLFETAAQTGGIAGNAPEHLETSLSSYGRHLGKAFQLIDDLLDYKGSSDELGKNIGDDLAEGKPTLPLIYTLQNGSRDDQQLIRSAIRQGGLENIKEITAALNRCGALDYTFEKARLATEKAIQSLEGLKASIYKDSLVKLAEASLERCY